MMFELAHRNQNHGMNTFNPFREMEEMERSFFGSPFQSFWNNQPLAEFKTDISDEGSHYLLETDLPGFDKKDIHLHLDGDMLTIQAERHSKAEQKDRADKLIRMERSYGSYSRQFDVSGIDQDHIKAQYQNGVLQLILPKKEAQQPETRYLEIE